MLVRAVDSDTERRVVEHLLETKDFYEVLEANKWLVLSSYDLI